MRYNVGDEVRVKKELSLDHKYDGFCWVAQPMEAFFGKVITIEKIQHEANKGYYNVVKENEWFWTDEMLEPVAVRVPIPEIDWSDWDELDSPISRAAKDITREQEERFKQDAIQGRWHRVYTPMKSVFKIGVPREMTVAGRRITPLSNEIESRKEIRKRLLRL